ncbi:arsenite-transporting ATPase [Evansella vedderi]|uniref:Arsenite-transporting ATPase n=1 Tax=Evansella vedderi TaxID=38282 RepID=A0ABT9ZS28_9BACI|nr:ArsA family ATPase [Evansella vedderi]MDQ0254040.1 arsenite-transporting ATPase [Evansella vedderi]
MTNLNLLDKKVIFVGGKGGVGKSTSASAIAMAASQLGKKVLLVSTDPAHNLSDLFHTRLKGEPKKVRDSLYVMEIDPEKESERYIKQVKENLQGQVRATMIEEVHRQIDMAKTSPGADEAALFDRITSLILEELQQFDLIIFDTAPTGHTLRLVSLPEMMGVWMDGMLERRRKTNEHYTQLLNDGEPVEDPIYQTLQKRRDKFKRVRDILLDSKMTGFLFVLNPERLPIQEAKRGIDTLNKHNIPVLGIIVNKVLPDEVDGTFFQKRKEQQFSYLQEIEQMFHNIPQIRMELLEEDISTLHHLETVAGRWKKEIS